MRIRSLPEISCPMTVKRGSVRRITQLRERSSRTRVIRARANPRRRARALWCSGSLSARIEIKTTLSMPSTISSSVSVRSAIRFSGLNKTSKRLRPFSGGQSGQCYPVPPVLHARAGATGFRLVAEPDRPGWSAPQPPRWMSGGGLVAGNAHAYEAVPRDEARQLLLIHAIRAGWAHRQHHVADVGRAVVDGDPRAIGRHEAELPHDGAGLADGPGTVLEALVPVGRAAEDVARVAGAEGAHDQVVDLRRVLHDDEIRGGDRVQAELDGRGITVREEPRLEALVGPSAGDEPGAVGRGARVHVGDVVLDLGLRQHALLDQQRLHRPAPGRERARGAPGNGSVVVVPAHASP